MRRLGVREVVFSEPTFAVERASAEELLEGGAELILTELKDEELLPLVAPDLNTAMPE